ncbi:MAG: glycosyltransferase [Coriobacteriia bacterium]|nr:glycosyltransferase [Coriobacteriia bacterium]
MDVVLAPTRFVEELATASLSGPKILHLPPIAEIPGTVRADRARWHFSKRDVVFISSFDLNSDLSRKNPHGVVRAFQSMRDNLDAATAKRTRLIIKVNNPEHNRSQAGRLQELRKLTAGDPAIDLIAESLPYPDVLSLYASADVFVSLHRGEGLGLGLLESMMLGVPVIATAYSGNLDFMTPNDSKLIRYRLVPVSGTSIGSYSMARMGPNQMWAEPDEADAARAMGELMDDEHRAALGAAARAAALATHSNPARAAAIETLLGYSETAPALSELAGLQNRPAGYWRARASAAGTLRRLGLVD